MVALVEQLPPLGQFVPLAAASEKSVPVPTKLRLCGLPGALSATVTEADRLPAAAGIKIKLMLQLAFAANVAFPAGQLFVCVKSPAFVPPITMLEIVSGALPVLAKLSNCAVLLVVMSWPPTLKVL